MQLRETSTEASRAELVQAVFLRMPSVILLTGLTRSTIYRLIADNQFPCPVRLGPRAVAWRRTDLDRWSAERPSSIG